METLSIVLAVIFVGLFFGLFQEIGKELAEFIFNKLKKPITLRVQQDDGSHIDVVMTQKEHEAHKRFMNAVNGKKGGE